MAINNGKHIVKDIDGVSCTIVDEKATKERLDFLQSLLTFNKLEVKSMANAAAEGENPTFIVGVTDVVFNPVISIYSKKLYTKFGKVVTPNYWNQIPTDVNLPYWTQGREVINFYKEDAAQ